MSNDPALGSPWTRATPAQRQSAWLWHPIGQHAHPDFGLVLTDPVSQRLMMHAEVRIQTPDYRLGIRLQPHRSSPELVHVPLLVRGCGRANGIGCDAPERPISADVERRN